MERAGVARQVKPRLLLVVHSARRGGAELMALEQARRLAGRFELTIAMPDGTLTDDFRQTGEVVDRSPSLPIWGGTTRTWVKQTLAVARDATRLARIIRRRKIVTVVASSSVSVAAPLAARMTGVPSVVFVRDSPLSRLSPVVYWLLGRLAHTVVVITGAMLPRFKRARARTVVIHDGIPVNDLPTPAPPLPTRLRMVLIGALDNNKGQVRAVEALDLLQQRGIGATLDLIGSTDQVAEAHILSTVLACNDLASSVKVLGPIPDAGERLGDYDLLLVPSLGEMTPLTIMEALLRGRPVVASDVGGVREMLRDGELGVLVPPGNARALADGIEAALADRALWDRVYREGPRWIRSHYSAKVMAAESEQLIAGLVQEAGSTK